MLLDVVSSTIGSHVQREGGVVLVALSGGADSVCLLLSLHELGYDVVALHCNFELRGKESDSDELFVRRLCKQYEIKLEVKHFRTSAYARHRGISIEMAARELRYEWFSQMCDALSAQAIAVGHHRNDQVETMLLNLVRGTGLHGLTGMQVMSEQRVLRPLLSLTKQEIEDWLRERGQTWVTDRTNLDADAATRNKIRLEVIPLLQQLNPAFVESASRTMQHLSEAELIYKRGICAEMETVCPDGTHIDITALKNSVSAESLLFEIMHPKGFNSTQINEVLNTLDGEAGTTWESDGWRLLRDRRQLILQDKGKLVKDYSSLLPLEGTVSLPCSCQLIISRAAVDFSFVIPRSPDTACFDVEKLQLPLAVRTIRKGDRMHPFGMKGSRLVSDILTDCKLSLFEREQQLVVVDREDTLLWLVGIRVAAGFGIDTSTRNAMTLRLSHI
ncbi:MAG: tRNA lysidine(34) synthetase TilS [Bacteroidaceae bacterium]|nr:tRNA lysidine(34) synthetase TilS [Bacteroidaceae bacterium]